MPAVYERLSALLRGRWRAEYVSRYVRPSAGDRVLDLGCGTGDIRAHLPASVHYVGVDASIDYIGHARRRYGDGGQRFVCAPLDRRMAAEFSGFQIVMANGVIHHLDDEAAGVLFAIARAALGPSGRLVTIDGCRSPDQSPVARFFLEHDRGKFVRDRSGYERLARAAFSRVAVSVRQNLIRIPYTHIIMVCRP